MFLQGVVGDAGERGPPDQTETRYESLCHQIGFKNIFLDYERPKISVCVI